MNTHNKQEELIGYVEAAKLAGFNAKTLSYDGKGGGYSNQMEGYYDTKSAVRDIQNLINSEVNTVLERLKEEADKEIKASQDNLEYAKTNNQSERTIANWEGCIQGENFIKSAITALQQEYKEKK